MQNNELLVKQLMDDLASSRRALAEREEQLSRLRIEVRETSTRIVNYKACQTDCSRHTYVNCSMPQAILIFIYQISLIR